MAIEKSESGTTFTGEHVHMFHHVRVAHALALDIKGIPLSGGSVMNVARNLCGTPKRTKRGVLIDYVAWLKKEWPGWEPSASILASMEKPAKK